jgi:hypothetical protein
MQYGLEPWTFSMDMQQVHGGFHFKDMQQGQKMQHEHGHAAHRFSREMQHGNTA